MFAHHEPDLVLRLVRRIRALSPGSVVVVRHAESEDFLSAGDIAAAGGVLFRSDIEMTWGSWAMVEGMVEALRWAVDNTSAAWLVAISGQDYPVMELRTWESSVSGGAAAGLVAAERLTDTTRYRYRFTYVSGARAAAVDRVLRGPVRRVARGLWWYGSARWQHAVWLTHLPRGLGYGIGFRRRSDLLATTGCWKGSQWFTLDRAVVAAVLAMHDVRADLREQFRHTYIPDEAYLQTLANLTGRPIVHAKTTWTRFVDAEPHPRPVDAGAVADARTNAVPFVRKVDATMGSLLDEIDTTTSPECSESAAAPQ